MPAIGVISAMHLWFDTAIAGKRALHRNQRYCAIKLLNSKSSTTGLPVS